MIIHHIYTMSAVRQIIIIFSSCWLFNEIDQQIKGKYPSIQAILERFEQRCKLTKQR